MARPVKYSNDSEMYASAKEAAVLVKEIRTESGLSYKDLSGKLTASGLKISESMFKQYSSGQKPMGEHRRFDLALFAYESGWRGKEVQKVLFFHDPQHNRDIVSLTTEFNAGITPALKMLEDAVRIFTHWGYDRQKILEVVLDHLRKLPHDLNRE